MKQLLATIAGITSLTFTPASAEVTDHSDHSDHATSQHNSGDFLGSDFSRGWLDPVGAHKHSSTGDSLYVHPLTVEAAFNDNDFFIDYAFNSFDDEDEHEIEVELELALTRRFGLVIETAYEFENEGGSTNEGFADLGIAARIVLIEHQNFIATANLEFGIPIGDDDFSENQFTIEPGLLFWFNLGNGFSLNTAIGVEHGTESEETELSFDAALVKQVYGPLALTLESRNTVGINGDERGDITSEATLGAIYQFSDYTAIRAGWSFPIDNSEFNSGGILSLNYAF